MNTIEFLLMIIIVFLAYSLGYMFTETKYDLQKYKLFQFKAFACRPCLSFHICWVLQTIAALALNNGWMLAIGILFSFALFLGLKIDEKNKFIKE